MTDRTRTAAETWNRIQAMSVDDDLEDVLAMSEAELDREIVAAGGDPKEIGERGAALAEKLLARRAKQSPA
jgi:hypothetical protein